MNLDRLLTRPVEITNRTDATMGDDGETIPAQTSKVTVLGYVEQTSTSETTRLQQTASGQWWAALPAGTPVSARSSLKILDSGQVFEVAGEPATRWSPQERRNVFIRVELESRTA